MRYALAAFNHHLGFLPHRKHKNIIRDFDDFDRTDKQLNGIDSFILHLVAHPILVSHHIHSMLLMIF